MLATLLAAGTPSGRALLADRDLALNRPGQAARQQSRELTAQAPVRLRLARAVGLKTEQRNWHIGAEGEEKVGRRLDRLGAQWRVLHAVPVGERDSDIDHVVICPGGVFTINVKHHPKATVWARGDTVKVNGFNQPYVRNSRHETRRAAGLFSAAARLNVAVHGVVAVVGADRGFIVRQQPADGLVTIVRDKDLAPWLAAIPPVLGLPVVEHIYLVARHLATWHPTTVRWHDFGTAGRPAGRSTQRLSLAMPLPVRGPLPASDSVCGCSRVLPP
jgi:hypothetical protein